MGRVLRVLKEGNLEKLLSRISVSKPQNSSDRIVNIYNIFMKE